MGNRKTFGRGINGRFVLKKEYQKNTKEYCAYYIRNMFLKIRNLCGSF
jgi:hypothetical protein